MLKKIYRFILKRKLLKEYYEKQAEKIMEEYLREDKTCIGIYGKNGTIKEIRKLKIIKSS